MISLYQEYKKSLKDISVEEVMDLYLFRPIAFVFVKLIYRLPVTPNQLSFCSVLFGIMSAIFFARGDSTGFLYAGIFFGLTRVIDCSDGIVARLKKNGTVLGRIIDGIADYSNGILVYAGFGIGLAKTGIEFPVSPWLLVILSAIFMAMHSIIIDYNKSEFMAHALGKKTSTREDKKLFSEELEKIKRKKGKYIDKVLIRMYLWYLSIQTIKSPEEKKYDQKMYYDANRQALRLLTLTGSSTYIFMLMVSSLLYKPAIFFYYAIGVSNVWMFLIWVINIRTSKRIVLKPNV